MDDTNTPTAQSVDRFSNLSPQDVHFLTTLKGQGVGMDEAFNRLDAVKSHLGVSTPSTSQPPQNNQPTPDNSILGSINHAFDIGSNMVGQAVAGLDENGKPTDVADRFARGTIGAGVTLISPALAAGAGLSSAIGKLGEATGVNSVAEKAGSAAANLLPEDLHAKLVDVGQHIQQTLQQNPQLKDAIDSALNLPIIGTGAKILKDAAANAGEGFLKGAAKSALKGAAVGAATSAAQGQNPVTGAIEGSVAGTAGEATGRAVGNLKGLAPDALKQKYIEQEKSDWNAPTQQNTPAFSKATKVAANAQKQGTDIGTVLQQNGVKLADNVDSGKYNTKDAADALRQDAGQSSHEVLRPSLEESNASVEKVPVKSVLQSAVQGISQNKSITQEAKNTLIAKVKGLQPVLEKQYPDGMSLTDLHDEKILRDKNVKYDKVTNNPAANIEAEKNKALADAMRSHLETNAAQTGIPVKDFNAALQQKYHAANYLDQLNGKKVPTSVTGNIATRAAKYIGAVVGEHLTGGLTGGIGGYILGGSLSHLIENMSNPVREYFLNNLERTNPEAFKSVTNQLQNLKEQRATQLALPAAGKSGAPLITPSPTTFEPPAKVGANANTGSDIRSSQISKTKIPSFNQDGKMPD